MHGKKLFLKRNGNDPKETFWKWFVENEARFRTAFRDATQAHAFLNDLITQMKPFNPWLKALAGPYGDGKFELIITADGDIALFCKVEELVHAAPEVDDWLITAHKPPVGSDNLQIDMYGYKFGADMLTFYPLEDANYPDEISIVVVHPGYTEEDHDKFKTAISIYLQNAIGELNSTTIIDEIEVKTAPRPDQGIELIPVNKLNDYLAWRQKEFVEKYASLSASQPEESYRVIEASGNEGKPVLAVINAGFRDWEYRSAYPWLVQVDIDYEGYESGMPNEKQLKDMQQMEDDIAERLGREQLAIFLGHETHDGLRTIFFYTDKFNPVSKIVNEYLEISSWDYNIVFHIRKDKYWKSMAFFFDAEETEEE
jgi:hypothetical protein